VDDRGQMTSVSRCKLPTATWAVHLALVLSIDVCHCLRTVEIFDPHRMTFDLSPTDNLHEKGEIVTENWLPVGPTVAGITTGASCPNNLIEGTFSVSTNCERSPRTSEPGSGRLKKRGSSHYYFSAHNRARQLVIVLRPRFNRHQQNPGRPRL
jgi:hypothetical protein